MDWFNKFLSYMWPYLDKVLSSFLVSDKLIIKFCFCFYALSFLLVYRLFVGLSRVLRNLYLQIISGGSV